MNEAGNYIPASKQYQPYILLIKIFKKENLFVFKGNMESSHKLKWQTEEIYYLILYIFSAVSLPHHCLVFLWGFSILIS